MLRYALIILSIGCISGCATVQNQVPLVQISKKSDGGSCRLMTVVTNYYPVDIEGNYFDIAVTDNTGKILARKNGRFNQSIFQSGYKTTIFIPMQTNCDSIAGVKIYTFAFEKPSGELFSGYDQYKLELNGF